MKTNAPNLHLGIAEQGKLFALSGRHEDALRHYREAMRLVQGVAGADIFFQHYSQCVMESLELAGHHAEVVRCCEQFLDFLAEKPSEPMIELLQAALWERMGVQFLFLDERKLAVEALEASLKLGGKQQPLAAELLRWAKGGYLIQPKRLQELQRKHHYFVVRKEKVNAAIAVELPKVFTPF